MTIYDTIILQKEEKKMENNKKPFMYRLTRRTVRFFYKKYKVDIAKSEPALYIGNHCKAHGPLAYTFYFPPKKMIWVIGEMFDRKTVPEYAYEDFFRNNRPKWFFKFLSRVISRPFSYLIRNAETIAVYKDFRVVSTLKKTVAALQEGNSIVIMPECRKPYNDVLFEFQDNYIEVARLYYKATGLCLKFYPTYLAPKLKRIVVGEPITFNPNESIVDEKLRINSYLKEEITKLYSTLPKHRAVLYI